MQAGQGETEHAIAVVKQAGDGLRTFLRREKATMGRRLRQRLVGQRDNEQAINGELSLLDLDDECAILPRELELKGFQ